MNITTLDEKLDKRSKEATQRSIRNFRKTVEQAMNRLLDECGITSVSTFAIGADDGSALSPESLARRIMEIFLHKNQSVCPQWPKALWHGTRSKTETEILGQMDAVQRMLLSKGSDPNGPVIDGSE